MTLLSAILLFGCTETLSPPAAESATPVNYAPAGVETMVYADRPEKQMVLGAEIPNPYSLENMQNAMYSLYEHLGELEQFGINKTYLDAFSIEPTDKYVRFLLKDSIDEYILDADTSLILIPHPLHREILEAGDYYCDADSLLWLYAVVPYDYTLNPNITSETLEVLFIPEHSPLLPTVQEWMGQTEAMNLEGKEFWYNDGRTPLENDFMHCLEAAAFRAAGYELDDTSNQKPTEETLCWENSFWFVKWTD